MMNDELYMSHAIRLAKQGLYTTAPNPRVGCVVVAENQVIGEGWHQFAGEPHAEVHALQQAGTRARAATAYVTLEPCAHHGRTPPCSQALIEAGVVRVVVAMQDPNPLVAGKGIAELREAGIQVTLGTCEAQAEMLNPGFNRRMRDGRPYTRCKLAMSLDGRTAMASGESQWITSAEARRDAHLLRARSDAIVTGIGTVLADDPSLTVRLDEVASDHPLHAEISMARQRRQPPLRVVLDSSLRTPASAKLLQANGDCLLMTGVAGLDPPPGAEILVLPSGSEGVNLHAAMAALAARQLNEVLVEAGATLSGSLLQAGLLDELVIYVAPTLMGDAARGLMRLPGLDAMADRIELSIIDIVAVGRDWRIRARPMYKV